MSGYSLARAVRALLASGGDLSASAGVPARPRGNRPDARLQRGLRRGIHARPHRRDKDAAGLGRPVPHWTRPAGPGVTRPTSAHSAMQSSASTSARRCWKWHGPRSVARISARGSCIGSRWPIRASIWSCALSARAPVGHLDAPGLVPGRRTGDKERRPDPDLLALPLPRVASGRVDRPRRRCIASLADTHTHRAGTGEHVRILGWIAWRGQ
jgi:hypothetical protein